jgi:benzoyl-CoA reductase/2-hydroxyglutaryl-CoA dehydratase subunit BcrC/BadD/HgdB
VNKEKARAFYIAELQRVVQDMEEAQKRRDELIRSAIDIVNLDRKEIARILNLERNSPNRIAKQERALGGRLVLPDVDE